MARLVIDGYNLLAVSGHKDREQLLTDLIEYRNRKGHEVTIVFDGTHRGTGRGDRYHSSHVEVMFSPLTVTADDTIEELFEQPLYREAIVVSSDRRVQSAALRAGSTYVESHEFSTRLRRALQEEKASRPWEEGRNFDDDEQDRSGKKGSARKLSKQERIRQSRLKKL